MNTDYTPWVKAMELAKSVAASERQSVIVYHRLSDGQWFVCAASDRPPTGRVVKYAVHSDSPSQGGSVRPAHRRTDNFRQNGDGKRIAGGPIRERAAAKPY